ncbi:glycosyltransferase [Microbacterium sp. A588]
MASNWSLVTVTYNSAATLRRFWANGVPSGVEWIVVDNASSDDSAATASELGAQVIRLEENLGFSAANNRGLTIAQGHYVAFVNPDVTPDWTSLPRLQETIDETGGLVAPQLLNADGSLQPNGRGAPLLPHKIVNRLSRGPRSNGYQVLAADGERRTVFWLIGAVVVGSAAAIRSLDGWNERFFLYYEDKDLSIRAWQRGLSVTLDGGVRWTHGWARETSTFRLTPWVREFQSMAKFYTLYPELLFGGPAVRRKHPRASTASGQELTDTQ